MKLSKIALVFLAGGIFVILVGGLFLTYSQQEQEQIRLQEELSSVKQMLTKYSPKELSSRQEEVESQLVQAGSELEAAKANLRQSIESIEATDTLFEVAKTSGVEVIGTESVSPTSKILEGIRFSLLPLKARVTGDVPNLVNFILGLSRKFPTSTIESVIIVTYELAEEGEGEELEKPVVDLTLLIHTYEGD
ncbi:hypothetical protein ES703_117572 [subsurface metagenome]